MRRIVSIANSSHKEIPPYENCWGRTGLGGRITMMKTPSEMPCKKHQDGTYWIIVKIFRRVEGPISWTVDFV